ncbi:MAG: Multi-sensor signal transduction histidine kinase [Edaphobacter sp.]|jgi:signal transduction histidine kinase|nr:Multi-sensor signal transduction histidine kinase [Edaphobacter sp.]
MQATQSRTALGIRNPARQFVAACPIEGKPVIGFGARPKERRPIAGLERVAEGAGLAHDASNLLGALSLYSELLAMPGVLHEEHKEYAEELRMLSERSWAMIDRLVNHARLEQKAEATVLPEVVERCRGLLNGVAGRVVEITWNSSSFRPVSVASEAVERIVINLVKNAAEAMTGEGAIQVSLRGLGDRGARRVVMTVSDTGCGMSEERVRALQEMGSLPGLSGSSAGGRFGGHGRRAGRRGIGFRVVRELAALSGGCLEIASELGVGTRVSVEWAC